MYLGNLNKKIIVKSKYGNLGTKEFYKLKTLPPSRPTALPTSPPNHDISQSEYVIKNVVSTQVVSMAI